MSSAIRLNRLENVKYEDLRGFEKAAILMNYLGPDAAKKLFKFVDDGDIRKLLGVMQKYRIVPVEVTKRVLEEYYELVSESADYIFTDKTTSKDTVVDAVGEERARGILGHLSAASPAAIRARANIRSAGPTTPPARIARCGVRVRRFSVARLAGR